MQRQMMSGFLGVGLGLIVMWTASAAEEGAPPAPTSSAKAGPVSPELSKKREEALEREKVLRDWRAKLAGTRWELQLTPSGAGGEAKTDVLSLTQRTIESENLSEAGYPNADNYSLYSPTEQSISWETMQSMEDKKGQHTAIWRGEVTGETMQGTLFTRTQRGEKETTEQFSFTGHKLVQTPPAPAPAPEAAPTTAPQATSTGAPQPAVGEATPAASTSAPARPDGPPAESPQAPSPPAPSPPVKH